MLNSFKIITTANKVINVKGKVIYNDRKRKIDLKRPIRDLFDHSSVDVFYMMELCLSKERAMERLKQLNDKNVMPVMLYFVKGDKND